ncbi:Uncharacterised protein [Mycobacteroides abscessus]|nr:Uncharacterised protein [Mycobacteroides abscessus]
MTSQALTVSPVSGWVYRVVNSLWWLCSTILFAPFSCAYFPSSFTYAAVATASS